MKTLEEMKRKWNERHDDPNDSNKYNQETFEHLIRSRVNKHTNTAMRYFWASFALQILVYALLSHVIVNYWPNIEILGLGVAGILLYIPFTVVLLRKFKAIATTNFGVDGSTSMYRHVNQKYTRLKSFYRFKNQYELMLIPLSSIIGIVIIFNLYVPGGVLAHLHGAGLILAFTLASCILAIRSENKKRFEIPLHHLKEILREFEAE